MERTIDNLIIEEVEHLDSNTVNVSLRFDRGLNYYEGGVNLDANLELDEEEIRVDSFKINFVEDEDEEPVKFTFNSKDLANKIESLLYGVMNRSFTNEDERQIILALS